MQHYSQGKHGKKLMEIIKLQKTEHLSLLLFFPSPNFQLEIKNAVCPAVHMKASKVMSEKHKKALYTVFFGMIFF